MPIINSYRKRYYNKIFHCVLVSGGTVSYKYIATYITKYLRQLFQYVLPAKSRSSHHFIGFKLEKRILLAF